MAKEVDIFRDTYVRYLGYANEVGEAFRPLVSSKFVTASYGVAVSYVCADVVDKSWKIYKKEDNATKAAITAGDVFLWQMLASVMIPGLTINRITWASARLLKQTDLPKKVVKALPTAIGLTSIPLIIHPIDHLVDKLMDATYRKWLN